jgi:hypothetical protein
MTAMFPDFYYEKGAQLGKRDAAEILWVLRDVQGLYHGENFYSYHNEYEQH